VVACFFARDQLNYNRGFKKEVFSIPLSFQVSKLDRDFYTLVKLLRLIPLNLVCLPYFIVRFFLTVLCVMLIVVVVVTEST
jgi:hypothetical protein